VGVQRSGRERWAELLTAVWKQAPVAVPEKARDAMLGVQHVPLPRLRSAGEQCQTASRAFGHVHSSSASFSARDVHLSHFDLK